ncbi:unnamed protein product, partial [Symbiodinium pilosum]
AKSTALTKGKPAANKGILKVSLKAKNLAKLGKLKLKDKIAKAVEQSDGDVEAVAKVLQEQLTPQEKQSAWSKHQTWLKNQGSSSDEKQEYEAFDKKAKGLAAVMHLIKADKTTFLSATEEVANGTSLNHQEKWVSWTRMLTEFTEEELYAHIARGRVQWRNDPWTAGLFQYMDTGDLTKITKVKKAQAYKRGQEYNPEEQDHQDYEGVSNMHLTAYLQKIKGKGKGKELALTKGQGKGKDKGKKPRLALKDLEEGQEESTEQAWEKVSSKAKKARDLLCRSAADLDVSVKKTRLSKASKEDATHCICECSRLVESLKVLLAKREKAMSLTKAKELLVEAAEAAKAAKEESKELLAAANKAASRASKASSSKKK